MGSLTTGSGGALACVAGHSYDRAAAGYYNLLLTSGGIHGDNREMVEARREFLNRGYYEPLARRVASLATEYTERDGYIVDAGCGEAYYTDMVESAVREKYGQSQVYAFDISKDAVKRAAKRTKNVGFAVCGSYHMPIKDASCDTVINIFSPMAKDEVYRVLRVGGKFILVFPGEEHLFGLKAAIYEKPYKNTPADKELSGFKIVKEERLRYDIELSDKESIASLFLMTPYAYRTPPKNRERVLSLEKIDTECDFLIIVYEKREN